ncbi:MAG: YerC/YecD family TrpR-related protein [Vescimonas sp.]
MAVHAAKCKIAKKEKNDRLYKAILTLETEEECYNFFQDLCTIPELRSMEQRYEVATLLNNGLIYNDILERTGASSATISRVNRSLIYGAGGYESVLEKMKELEEKEKAEKEPEE